MRGSYGVVRGLRVTVIFGHGYVTLFYLSGFLSISYPNFFTSKVDGHLFVRYPLFISNFFFLVFVRFWGCSWSTT